MSLIKDLSNADRARLLWLLEAVVKGNNIATVMDKHDCRLVRMLCRAVEFEQIPVNAPESLALANGS